VREIRKRKLQENGWKLGTADEFLGLSAEESAFLELKISLSDTLKSRRLSKKLTQEQFALLINSSQSRVAKMEAADPTVSIDLLLKSLLVLGVSKTELGQSLIELGHPA
jgi:hypothetical protein